MDKQLYFSATSGVIYELPKDMNKALDQYQVPLLNQPKSNCTKCFGRLYTGYNLSLKAFNICPKCGHRIIDYVQIKEHMNVETPKQANEPELVDAVKA